MRLEVQLYIVESNSHTQIDLFDYEGIELVQTIQDVKDIKKVFTDFSRTFTVPASKINNTAFKHFYNPNIGRDQNPDLNLAFDAKRRIDAEIHLNYRLFKKGRIQLESANMKNGKAYSYSLTFFGDTIKMIDDLSGRTLDELSELSDISFDFTDANMISLLQDAQDIDIGSTTYADSLLVPLITTTKAIKYDSVDSTKENNVYPHAQNKGIPIDEFKPAIRLHTIVKAIEEQFPNISFISGTDTGTHPKIQVDKHFFRSTSDGFADTNIPYYNLFVWLNKEKGRLIDRDEFGPIHYKFSKDDFTDPVGDTGEQGLSDTYHPAFLNGRMFIYDKTQVEHYLEVRITPTTKNAKYNFILKKDNEEYYRFDNLVGDEIPLGINLAGTIDQGLGLPTGYYTFHIETFSANDFSLVIKHRKNRSATGTLNIFTNTFEVSFTASKSISTSKEIKITDVISNKLKLIDLMSALFNMFNLTAEIDPFTGKLLVRTLDDFYAQGEKINITKYVDRSDHIVKPSIPYKNVSFEYEGRDTIFAAQHERELSRKGWGSERYPETDIAGVETTTDVGEDYNVSVPIEHHKFNRLYNQDDETDTNNLTPVQWGYSVDEDENAMVGKPLLFYPIKLTDLSFGSATTIDVVVAGSSNAINRYHAPFNHTELTNSQTIHFGVEKSEYQNLPFSASLFETYYGNYIRDVFDIESRLFTYKAYIPSDILINIRLNDILVIYDTEYRIKKLSTNFLTGLTTLELLNLRTVDTLGRQNLSDVATNVSRDVVRIDTTMVKADLTTRTI